MRVPHFKTLAHFLRFKRHHGAAVRFASGPERDDEEQRLSRHVFASKNTKMCCFDLQKQQCTAIRAAACTGGTAARR